MRRLAISGLGGILLLPVLMIVVAGLSQPVGATFTSVPRSGAIASLCSRSQTTV